MAAPKKYPDELRARAVRLYREADPEPVIRRLAEQLGVHPEALRNRIRQAEADRGERADRPSTDMVEENRRLREEVLELRRANAILKAASVYFAQELDPDPATVMRFIDEHRDQFAVALLLRVLCIAESTYYGWVGQDEQPCDRELVDRRLLSNIHEIWTGSGCTYGSDRVWRQLRRDGIGVGRKRVERLMRGQGWQGAFLRRGWRHGSTRQDATRTPAPDRVRRDFSAAAPNRLWVADATRIPCGEGVFWLAAVRDAFSNRIVGWRCSDRCDTDLVLGALEYGIWTRDVRDGQLIHHSDKGSNYTSLRFGTRLSDNGIVASMGSTGDSYDNALMEDFWSTLKTELVYRTSWRTRDEAENVIFGYIDGWYNTRRIQAGLGDLSPDEYETAWLTASIDQPEPSGTTLEPAGSR